MLPDRAIRPYIINSTLLAALAHREPLCTKSAKPKPPYLYFPGFLVPDKTGSMNVRDLLNLDGWPGSCPE